MVNTICVNCYDNIDGWLLFGNKNSHLHGCHVVVVVSFLLTPMLMGVVVVLVVQDSIQIEGVMSVELLVLVLQAVWVRPTQSVGELVLTLVFLPSYREHWSGSVQAPDWSADKSEAQIGNHQS
jgi:hypothetical protein